MTQISAPGWYPGAIHRPIKPGVNDPQIVPTQCIFHTDASNATSLFNWFSGPSGGIESHGHIRKDGSVEQYRGIFWEADANFKANPRAVSWETQGFGTESWTKEQLATMKDLLLWQKKVAKLKLVVPKSWDSPGVGYHIMFDEWHPEAKSCPGPLRIEQYKNIIVPWMQDQNWSKKKLLQHISEAISEADSAPDSRLKIKKNLSLLNKIFSDLKP